MIPEIQTLMDIPNALYRLKHLEVTPLEKLELMKVIAEVHANIWRTYHPPVNQRYDPKRAMILGFSQTYSYADELRFLGKEISKKIIDVSIEEMMNQSFRSIKRWYELHNEAA